MDTIDPYMAMAQYEKMENPQKRIMLRAFRRRDVMDVDRLIEISKGDRDTVRTDSDWRVIEELCKFFASRWPDEAKEFRDAIPDIRSTRASGGYNKNKEIRYVGAIPPRLMRLIKIIFPYQQYDKIFVNKLVKKIPILEVGGAT